MADYSITSGERVSSTTISSQTVTVTNNGSAWLTTVLDGGILNVKNNGYTNV